MPSSRDGIQRQPEDPSVQPPEGRKCRLESEEKKPALLGKRLVPKVGEVLDEGGPGEKRGEKMRFKERPIGRSEKDALQRLPAPRQDRHRIDGRPDGAAFVVEQIRSLRDAVDCRSCRPADGFREPERKTPGRAPTGDEVRAERLAHGRFSCGVEFGYRHERRKVSEPIGTP